MDENEFEGAARDLGGKIQDAVSGLTGDSSTQVRGKANQAAGRAQDFYGKTADEVRNFVSDQPIVTLLSQ